MPTGVDLWPWLVSVNRRSAGRGWKAASLEEAQRLAEAYEAEAAEGESRNAAQVSKIGHLPNLQVSSL
ncbi:hypothetical protein [Mycolicibacterium porcinum]|uniref:hypothetical protein n=1 Tax=Mycolicibacterium porcinum TaxID=39693 RepID=UPI001041FF76|nr:hypothetical protein [Mycolicibacterium porcinum]